MTDILRNGINIAQRVRDMQISGTLSMIIFGVVLIFGIVNCILGYRLLRFWMMIFGFLMGAGIGLFAVHEAGITNKTYYMIAMLAAGAVLAIIAFAIFKAGIFIMGAGIGLTLTVYVIHPTTSFAFFICLLAGVGLGFLAMRYEREVIIIGTSVLGGVLSGFATAKLAGMEEIPFGIIFSAGFALVGLLIQFAINKPKYEDDEDDEEGYETKRDKRRDYEKEKTKKRIKAEAFEDSDVSQDNVRRKRDRAYASEEELDVKEERSRRHGAKETYSRNIDAVEVRKRKLPEYEEPEVDPDDDLAGETPEETEIILEKYGVDEDDVIEEYLEDYYGENKRKKKSASPYRKNSQGKKPGTYKRK